MSSAVILVKLATRAPSDPCRPHSFYPWHVKIIQLPFLGVQSGDRLDFLKKNSGILFSIFRLSVFFGTAYRKLLPIVAISLRFL